MSIKIEDMISDEFEEELVNKGYDIYFKYSGEPPEGRRITGFPKETALAYAQELMGLHTIEDVKLIPTNKGEKYVIFYKPKRKIS